MNILIRFIGLYGLLYQVFVPCTVPEQLYANTVDHQQHLGKWYFKAAASPRDVDIHKFKELDNLWFTMEEPVNDTLLLTGHIHIGDNCMKETWTYRIRPERDDVELEARQSDVDSEVVTTFLKNPACYNVLTSVISPQEKGLSFK
ncbi:apolipoprotein M [Sebastes umbrosus]|uniref:apolipoprotein M n=1 Tax=Sebastes umbrosus TaxID=72105 RepID=UPI00189D75CD|nr:apolipoprotein M [Sebastes umbrosus]